LPTKGWAPGETAIIEGVRSRQSWLGNLPAMISLLAVAVMAWASLVLPYINTLWPGTYVGFAPDGRLLVPFPTATLAQGPDPSLVLVTLAVLALAAASQLLGIRRRITGAASFGAALAVALAGIYPTLVVPEPLDSGFSVFLVAAIVAAIAGLAMVVLSFRGTRLASETALPAAIALLTVAVISWASFLPYVQFSWADGGFSFPEGSFPTGPPPTSFFAQGSDAFLLLVTLAVLGVAAASHLVGIRRRITGVATFGASLVAVAIVGSFQGTLGFGTSVDDGFYVLLAAATVAALAGLAMVVLSFRGMRLRIHTALRPTLP
jgi:hypothetical protein